MRWNSDQRLLLELALIKAAQPEFDLSQTGILNRLKNLEQKMGRSSAEESEKTIERHEKKEEKVEENEKMKPILKEEVAINIQEVINSWEVVLDEVKKATSVTHALLIEGHPAEISDKTLYIDFPSNASFHSSELAKENNLAIITEVCQQVFNCRLNPQVRLVENEMNEQDVINNPEAESKEEFTDSNNAIQIAQDSLDARVVEEEKDQKDF